MSYIAIKPCRFAGQSFDIGAEIPAELVQPGAAKRLIKMGRLAAADGTELQVTPVVEPPTAETEIVIHANDGDMSLKVTKEGLQAIFDVLGSTVGAAESTIEQITDEDALILLHASDSRKSIKELAFARADELAHGGE